MNILFLSTWFPYPCDNGSKLRVYYLLRALAERHRVTLLSFAFATANIEDASEALRWCDTVQTVALNPFQANQIGRLQRFFSPQPAFTRPIASMRQLVGQAFQLESFDAVVASVEVMATYALQAPASTVRILEEHNSLSRWMWDRSRERSNPVQSARCWVSWQKARRYEADLFPRFDLVTVVSTQDRAATQALPGYRGCVEVVPNGVDCAHNRPGLWEPAPHALVFNGALTYDANYDAIHWYLAAIYPRIKRAMPDVTLTITGSTTGVNLTGLELDPSVCLTGYVTDVRMPVAQAAVCVVPLRQGGGTRLKILEAMALGIPVVATTKGAEGLNIVDGEHFLCADDPSTFAARTVLLLQDTALRHRLANNARRLVETTYDWSQIGAHFVSLVESAVENARKRSA